MGSHDVADPGAVEGGRAEDRIDPDDGGVVVHVGGGTVAATIDTTGLATAAKQDINHADLAAILAKMLATPATETKQDALITANHVDLAAILAKIIAAPATAAAQTDGTQRSNPSPSTPYSSGALEASCVLKASAGTFRSLMVQLDTALASGTYYVQLLTASATVPANGAVTFLRPPQTVVHVLGQAEVCNFFEGDSGIAFTVGCTACVSTSQFTKTLVGTNCATFAGSVL